jgi:Fanconi anemia group J protein
MDIEDLVTLSKSHNACPYYTSRALVQDAEIVFCPYSYLLDPFIRKRMDIDLTDSIIILDEAHNIEDVSVDAASWQIGYEELQV